MIDRVGPDALHVPSTTADRPVIANCDIVKHRRTKMPQIDAHLAVRD